MVAILDDVEHLRLAIREIHTYAVRVRELQRPRRGIVFRVVDEREQQAIAFRIQNLAGMRVFNSGIFQVPAGHWHIIDDSQISHTYNRHSNPTVEVAHGQLAVTLVDFQRIPEIVQPKNIIEFAIVKRMPRIVYSQTFSEGTLTVVQEIQSGGLVIKTTYKKK